MDNQPLVSIIILNWNGGAANCLESVVSALHQDYPHKEIIFVDNGSSDGSFDAVRQAYPREVVYVGLEKNIGCPPGRNVGARIARGELIFFLENDGAWDSHQLVGKAVEFFAAHPDVAACYTKVTGYESNVADSPLDPFKPADGQAVVASSFRGGASVLRRAVFEAAGLFPEDFFRQAEERYVSLLMYEMGYKVAYWPAYSLRHKGSDYQGKRVQVTKFAFENELKILLRLYPRSSLFTIVPAKLLSYFVMFVRSGLIREYFASLMVLLKEMVSGQRRSRISQETLNLVEAIRYGHMDPAKAFGQPLADLKKAAPRASVIRNRLFK